MSQAAKAIALLSGARGEPIVSEALSGGAITPGMLIEKSGATVVVHATAADTAQKMFALSNLSTGGSIDDAYISGERVRFGVFSSGQKVNALVAASAPAIAVGDPLESAGDGTLRKVVTDAATDDTQRNSVVGYADVAVDNSGGATSVRLSVTVA